MFLFSGQNIHPTLILLVESFMGIENKRQGKEKHEGVVECANDEADFEHAGDVDSALLLNRLLHKFITIVIFLKHSKCLWLPCILFLGFYRETIVFPGDWLSFSFSLIGAFRDHADEEKEEYKKVEND